jgi:ABC-type nitrate/sulfonate/bicarbonate transport system permease component
MVIMKPESKNVHYYVTAYFVLWILLFEFLLPVNSVLPKPSIVLESFSDLWINYKLPINFISTVAVIYISLSMAYLFVYLLRSFLIGKNNFITGFILSLEWFSKYVPGIAIGLLLIFWFPDSEFIEFIFAFLTAFLSMVLKIQLKLNEVRLDYIDAARSLGMEERVIKRDILWKMLQPELSKHLFVIHLYIWAMLIAFEFMKGGLGIGVIFKKAIEFQDLSALFSTFLITGLTVYLGTALLKAVTNKFIYWSID